MADVAVTGASGFIGSAVVRQLIERGRSVRAILEPGANTKNLDGLEIARVTCDVTDVAAMTPARSMDARRSITSSMARAVCAMAPSSCFFCCLRGPKRTCRASQGLTSRSAAFRCDLQIRAAGSTVVDPTVTLQDHQTGCAGLGKFGVSVVRIGSHFTRRWPSACRDLRN